jgi:hypothetical protein
VAPITHLTSKSIEIAISLRCLIASTAGLQGPLQFRQRIGKAIANVQATGMAPLAETLKRLCEKLSPPMRLKSRKACTTGDQGINGIKISLQVI